MLSKIQKIDERLAVHFESENGKSGTIKNPFSDANVCVETGDFEEFKILILSRGAEVSGC